MGETLSQAEIEALLNGAPLPDADLPNGGDGGGAAPKDALSKDAAPKDALSKDAPSNDSLSKDAPAKDPNGAKDAEVEPGLEAFVQGDDPRDAFSPVEIDALGEIGNISMGNSATTLFSLLNHKVNITTPTVSINTIRRIAETYTAPLVVVKVEYTEGLLGTNMLILREMDVMVITDLMMGGDGKNVQGEITDLHLSAISEAMNQMIGNASTSLSNVFDMKIDISPPKAVSVKVENGELLLDMISVDPDEHVAVVLFDMTVEGLLDTKLMQIQPFSFAKKLVDKVISKNVMQEAADAGIAAKPAQAPPPAAQSAGAAGPRQQPGFASPPQHGQPGGGFMQQADGTQQPGYPPQYGHGQPPGGYAQPPGGYAQPQQYGYPPPAYVNVQPATFQPFDDETFVFDRKNIGLVMDVQLDVSVELGRTRKLIKDILEFGQGSIIELDKLAGEPVDILVNNKAIAKGEVVVIDESFGVRVMDIIDPSRRIG